MELHPTSAPDDCHARVLELAQPGLPCGMCALDSRGDATREAAFVNASGFFSLLSADPEGCVPMAARACPASCC